jgi:transcriptional regulator with XRE-family HTH domain
MSTVKFDGDAFFADLDAVRLGRKITWKKVADQSGVSPSTLTRIAQGRRPDVDSLAALCSWAALNSDGYLRPASLEVRGEPLAQVMGLLRADPNLSPDGVMMLESLIKSAYERLRKE